MCRSARGARLARSRGTSAIEYIIAVVFLAITGVAFWARLGTQYKCKVQVATASLFGSEPSAACSESGPAPPSSGGSGPASAGGSGGCPGGICMVGDNCFPAGTLVATERGARPIEAIAVGDRVLARDVEGHGDGALAWRPVLRRFVRRTDALVDLTLASSAGAPTTLTLTPEHRLFVPGRGWSEAATIEPGVDELVDAAGRPVAVLAAVARAADEAVYNLEVAELHSYFVGETAVWAHNECKRLRKFWDKSGKSDPLAFFENQENMQAVLESDDSQALLHDIQQSVYNVWYNAINSGKPPTKDQVQQRVYAAMDSFDFNEVPRDQIQGVLAEMVLLRSSFYTIGTPGSLAAEAWGDAKLAAYLAAHPDE